MPIQVKVPGLGESVKQATLLKWHINDGDAVQVDEPLCELETEKANTDIPAESAGVIHRLKKEGETVDVGQVIAEIDPAGAKAAAPKPQKPPEMSKPKPEDFSPAVRQLISDNHLDPTRIRATGPEGRLTKEDVVAHLANLGSSSPAPSPTPAPPPPPLVPTPATSPVTEKKKDVATVAAPEPAPSTPPMLFDSAGIHRAPLSKIRKRIAETLVQAQHTAAILTTYNEVDLTAVMELRAKFKERFQEVHGVALGFMSFFARASILALKEFPKINAFIEGDNVVYHQFVNLGIAVSTDRGLAVPVLRHAEKMSFAKIEAEIKRLAAATREGKLALEELSGGTFTITNGGIFGSLLSTPILNPPQSGILGMHAIQKRPVVINDKIEIRSMMYLALSYDHRLVDGRESVSFLVRLKQFLEDPTRLMLEI
jgi:2-oxoglutarate dehydrogenase E2 component (dihydrolipoamide succinyltransferase)